MNDMSQQPPGFDLELRSEVIDTRCFGKVTVRDVGADTFERLAIGCGGDTTQMMRRLLCESAEGPNGERFTVEQLEQFPARAFSDRIKLMQAAARVNGVSGDEVEKA